MELLWINLFVISRSFKKPLCVAKKGTVVGIVQNKPSLSQGMAQISDSRSILKPNRVIPSMFLIPQPCAYMFLTRFKAPITACRRLTTKAKALAKEVLGTQQQAYWIFSKVHPRPGTPWCHGAIAQTPCIGDQRNAL